MDHSSDSQRALRARLVELHGAVQGYFEATMVGARSGYIGAFDALRRNDHLAESFVGDLSALLEFIDRELVPSLSGKPAVPAATTPREAPRQEKPEKKAVPVPAEPAGRTLNDEDTMLITRMPENVQREILRITGQQAEVTTAPTPRIAPVQKGAAPPEAAPEIDDGDDSLLQEIVTDPEVVATTTKKDEKRPAAAPAAPPRVAAPAARPAPLPGVGGRPAAPLPSTAPPRTEPKRPESGKAPPLKSEPAKAPPLKSEPAKAKAPAGGGAIAARIAAIAAATPAASPAPQRTPLAKPAGREKASAGIPQFDESDLTNPGFTMDPPVGSGPVPGQGAGKKR